MFAVHRTLSAGVVACVVAALSLTQPAYPQESPSLPGGALQILGDDGRVAGACPLKHTEVDADIIGFVGRVTVRQVFHNPTDRKIEAIYVFPLPQTAAVDDMVMQVGDRRIVGQIKERAEAREIYEAARAAGHVASLLDQERPNIFTQSVANIEPGVEVAIEISYVETLKYEDGVFEWVFPMVVGPRYIPGGGSAPAPLTTGTPTPQVPDADRITPPVTPKGTRAGHDISLVVNLDAGMTLYDLDSVLHEVDAVSDGAGRATITLKNEAEIPNKDFILRYRLASEEIGDAYLVHEDERGRFFTLILQPPQRVAPAQVVPRELIFVLDTSGSMSGFPIEKAKEVMTKLIGTMMPHDTFNVITFAGNTRILWGAPRPATDRNIAQAQDFLAQQRGGGGTEMMKAINAALVQTRADAEDAGVVQPLRVVCFMTDGYVGNDMAIIDAIKKNADTTCVFSFGIGNSVNRFLLDNIAHAGRGEVEYVTLLHRQDAGATSQADAAVERFHTRVLAPVLTDIEIDWGTLPVADVYPQRIPDLFSAKPIMVHGRLEGEPNGVITLRGYTGAGPYEEQIEVSWPDTPPDHSALASLWARAKVDELMMRDYAAAQSGQFPDELKQEVIALGLEFRLMTQFTSFVAVEEMTVTAGGEPTTIRVPVEMPDGVSYEGVFGEQLEFAGQRGLSLSYGYHLSFGKRASARLGQPMATPPPLERPAFKLNAASPREAVALLDQLEADGRPATQPVLTPEDAVRLRLAESLQGLAEKVEQEGQDGNLAVGKLKVVNYRVDVMIFLRDTSEQTLAALQELGLQQTGESKAIRMLTGSIDVRKLKDLAQLSAVIRVRPVVEP